ncbi:VHA-19 protein [Aphelenchoides avenae]|nr:VHA-19 protein [Aphelenchus avenae]
MHCASVLFLLPVTLFALGHSASYEYTFPIIIPPYGLDTLAHVHAPVKVDANKRDVSSCLLYIEGLAVTVFKKGKTDKDHSVGSAAAATISGIRYLPGGKADTGYTDQSKLPTFTYTDGDAVCFNITDIKPPKGQNSKPSGIKDSFSFNVVTTVKEPVNAYADKQHREQQQADFVVGPGQISFSLTFSRDKTDWYTWGLVAVTGHSLEDLKLQNTSMPAVPASVAYMQVYGFGNYSYGCNCTKAALFVVDANYQIGLSFVGMQVTPYGAIWHNTTNGADNWVATFSPYVNDCVGTFSTGSVMGIVVGIIFASVLIFAFLMLNSIETLDRFDDPRQKPLVINFKE